MNLRGRLAGGLLTGALAAGLVASPAEAAQGTHVPYGRVVVVTDVFNPLPALPAPAEGVINSYGFTADVTGDECAPAVGTGNDDITGPAGSEVCVFSLDDTGESPDTVTDTGQVIPAPTSDVVVGSRRVVISGSDLDYAGPNADFVVAVPDGESATLVLGGAGFEQSFSLTEGKPVGIRPTVLYQSASHLDVSNLVGRTFRFTETAQSNGKTAALEARITSASLGWFLPGDEVVWPKNPSQAFLSLDFSERDLIGPGGVSFGDFSPLPGSALQLQVGNTMETATSVEAGSLGLLAGTEYDFAVPADYSGGDLLISPGTRLGYEDVGNSSTVTEVEFSAAGTAPPTTTTVPSSVVPAAGAPATTLPSTPVALTKSPRKSRSSAAVPPAAGTGGGVLVLLVPVVIVLRRRRLGKRIGVAFPRPGPLQTRTTEQSEAGAAERVQEQEAPSAKVIRGLEVRVLGQVEVEPLLPTSRRHAVVEACAYLAMNGDREVSSDEFRHVLGTAEKDLSASTFYNLVSELRKALGKDVLVKSGTVGYRFDGTVTCDWVSFRNLATMASSDETDRIAHLREALGLVRGYPFQAAAKNRYQWAYDRGYVEEIVTAVENAAVELCRLLLERDRGDEAYEAAQLGLRAARQSYRLHASRLRAARLDPGRLQRAFEDTEATLGVVPELADLKARLLAGSGAMAGFLAGHGADDAPPTSSQTSSLASSEESS